MKGASPGDGLLDVAIAAARAGGRELLDRFGGELTTSVKGDPSDLVSQADLAAEHAICRELEELCPDDGILSEETARRPSRSGRVWVLDPLDSTANFLRGVPIWAVSVACTADSATIAGAVQAPQLGELFAAERGCGIQVEGKSRSIPAANSIDEAAITVGLGRASQAGRSRAGNVVDALFPRVGKVRSPGSPSLGLAWTAAGRFDAAYYEMGFGPWDVAAGALLCREAGLAVLERPPLAPGLDPRIFAATESVVDELAGLLQLAADSAAT